MSESITAGKLYTKKDLRGRSWTHRQIKELAPSGEVIKNEVEGRPSKGRPAFGYRAEDVVAAEQARQSA
jgi:hypothetical protein